MQKRSWIILGLFLHQVAVAAVLPHTDARLYRPFESALLQATLHSTAHFTGICTEPSQQDNRGDAWRCQANKKIYDPCFVKTYVDRQTLICPQAPWSEAAVTIQLDHSLVSDNGLQLDMSQDNPWAIQLANGERCKIIKNSSTILNGEPVRYTCDTGVLSGDLQRCKPVWKIFFKSNQDKASSLVDVAVAWF